MALKVIGSGLGRTGTLSLKLALETLGFGPCHHMHEVLIHPASVRLWVDAGEGRADWATIFQDYAAAVDYPTAAYWRELADYYPAAKIIHTVRDPDAWFESTQATIFAPAARGPEPSPLLNRFFDQMMGRFGDKIHDREFMVAYFEQHNRDVQQALPKERLLIYEAGQGWEPICRFLGAPSPDAPYPSENSRHDFQRMASERAADPGRMKAPAMGEGA